MSAMMAQRPPVRLPLTAFAALALTAASAGALAASPQTQPNYAGAYVMTHVTGATVVRMELFLEADGHARLRTGGGRYTQRPTGIDTTQTVETGTWRNRGGRLVLHIDSYRSALAGRSDREKPAFEDRTFVLEGCELRLVGGGAGFAFDKKNCS